MSENHENKLNNQNEVIPDSTPSSPQKKTSLFKSTIEQIELIIIAFAIIILIFSFVTRTCEVSGASMEDTLYHKETVLISNLFYSPERGDIIVFHQTGEKYNEPIVKRVIGLPGDTVKIEYINNSMLVTVTDAQGNSQTLEEDYIKYTQTGFYSNSVTYVEDGHLFVLGDNRSVSADSRSQDIGQIDQRRILGKVILRLTPFSRFGAVK